MRHCKLWTQEEDLKLKELSSSGKMTFKEMMPYLPGRTERGIGCRAPFLGISLRNNGYVYKKHSKDENFWETPNIINCYWAGVALADMCVYGNSLSWALSVVDKGLIDQFIRDTKWTGKYRSTWNKATNSTKYTEIIQTSIYSCAKWIIDMEKNFNITPRKTYRLLPPTFNQDILNYSLFRGLLDGDGTLFFGEKDGNFLITIASCSENMILWVKNLVEKDFCDVYTRKTHRNIYHNKKAGCYNYAVHGIKAIKLYQLLDSIPTHCLERKWKSEKIKKALELYKRKYPAFFEEKRDFKFSENGGLIKPNFDDVKGKYDWSRHRDTLKKEEKLKDSAILV